MNLLQWGTPAPGTALPQGITTPRGDYRGQNTKHWRGQKQFYIPRIHPWAPLWGRKEQRLSRLQLERCRVQPDSEMRGDHAHQSPRLGFGVFSLCFAPALSPKTSMGNCECDKDSAKGRYQPCFLQHTQPSTHPAAPPAPSSSTLASITLINTRTCVVIRGRAPAWSVHGSGDDSSQDGVTPKKEES